MPWPKPEEQCVMVVNGFEYREWETVEVRHIKGGRPPYICRFTVSEGAPLASNLAKLQIKPGDECTVSLAGQPAFKGRVTTRQVYVDGRRHHVELIATTFMDLINGSAIFKTQEMKDATVNDIAKKVLDPRGYKTVWEGGAPPVYRFPRVSVMPGESIYDFIDHWSRATPTESGHGLRITSNPQGDFVFVMNSNGQLDIVTEGKNMLVGREIIYTPSVASNFPTMSQGPGSDKKHGPQVTHMPFFKKAENSPFLGNMPARVVFSEIATSEQQVLQGRNSNESGWTSADEVTVWVTVQGWLRPSGGLWDRNQEVIVVSPMLMMNGEKLKVKSLTFTQDDRRGTRTEIELTNQGGDTPPLKM